MTANEQKKAKLRFIALYACSLVLMIGVVAAFWKKGAAAQPAGELPVSDDEYFVQYDTLLHARMDQLDERYAIYLKNLQNGNKEATGFLYARDMLATTLDSIEKQASFLTSGPKKEAIAQVVARYKNSLMIRSRLINELTHIPQKSTLPSTEPDVTSTNTSDPDVENLKTMLAAKDQRIADLENQVKQNASQNGRQNTGGGSDEWKQKYNSLKSSYDKLAASEKSLRNAYKTVADDNKRLLGQLQSAKKG